MTGNEQAVRLVALGDTAGAPVCESDVCYLPESTVDEAGIVEPTILRRRPDDGAGSRTARAMR